MVLGRGPSWGCSQDTDWGWIIWRLNWGWRSHFQDSPCTPLLAGGLSSSPPWPCYSAAWASSHYGGWLLPPWPHQLSDPRKTPRRKPESLLLPSHSCLILCVKNQSLSPLTLRKRRTGLHLLNKLSKNSGTSFKIATFGKIQILILSPLQWVLFSSRFRIAF